MIGYVPTRGFRVPAAPYQPPYPRLGTGGVPYEGVQGLALLTMTSAALDLDPVDNTPLLIANLPAFSGPGGTFTAIRIIAQRDVDTLAPVADTLDVYVDLTGFTGANTNANLADAVVAAVNGVKAAFYPGIPFTLSRVGNAVKFLWDYAGVIANGVQIITDTDWSTNEENPFFSGGFDAQPLLPARRGPPYAWLPTLYVPPLPEIG